MVCPWLGTGCQTRLENIYSRRSFLTLLFPPLSSIWSLPRYRTNRILIPWGCDFMYQNASLVFSNTDLLMAHINANPSKYNMTMEYVTLDKYFADIFSDGVTWPTRDHTDFFPLEYAQDGGWQV